MEQQVYLNESGEAKVLCPNCGKLLKIKVGEAQKQRQALNITCPCKATLSLKLQRRIYYRKAVGLPGRCFYGSSNEEAKDITVENISMTGVGLRTFGPNSLKPGDVVRISFRLDDYAGSTIDRTAIVRNIEDRYVGAEFCDNKRDKALGFYLKI